MKRLSYALIASAAIGFAVAPVLAQQDSPPPGRGGAAAGGAPRGNMPQQMSPEQLKAVYEAQVNHVGKAAGLGADQHSKLVTAYLAARDSQTKAVEAARTKIQEERRAAAAEGGEGGRGRGGAGAAEEMQRALEAVNTSEREKFQKSISEFLDADQTKKVIGSLGNFDRQWDQLTNAVVTLKLDGDKQDQAMTSTLVYTTTVLKARENTDREAQREATVEARRKMMDDMRALLTEEQFGQFQRATGGAGRGQGAPGAGGRGGAGSEGQGGGAGGGRGRGGAGGGGGGGGR